MRNNKSILLGSALLAMTALTSCLKDTAIPPTDPLAGTNGVVAFLGTGDAAAALNSANTLYAQYSSGLVLNPDTAGFNVNVAYFGPGGAAPSDITVGLAVNATALTDYNTKMGTTFTVPPTDVFSFPSSVVIKGGTDRTTVRVTIKGTASYDYTKSYALPLSVTGTASVPASTNMGTAIYAFIVKNPYDGNYTGSGYIFHPSAPRAFSATYPVPTVSPTSNRFPFGDLASSSYYFALTVPSAGGALTGYVAMGAMPAPPKSGLMTMDVPNPAGGSFSGSLSGAETPGQGTYKHSTYNNTYDKAAKTFWIHSGYDASGNGEATFTRQMYAKFVKQ